MSKGCLASISLVIPVTKFSINFFITVLLKGPAATLLAGPCDTLTAKRIQHFIAYLSDI